MIFANTFGSSELRQVRLESEGLEKDQLELQAVRQAEVPRWLEQLQLPP